MTSEAVAVKISGTNGDISGSDVTSSLQLSSSQVRAILLRSNYGAVLTTCQRACAERILVKGEQIQPDEPQKSKPLPTVASSIAAGTQLREELRGDSAPLRAEVESVRQELKAELDSVRQELQTELASVKLELKSLHDDMKVNVVQHLQSMASRRPASDQSIRAALDTVRADLTSTIESAHGDVDARVRNLLEVLNEARKERTAPR
ncbi:hypothetical protein UCDDA912_g10624 [Diaporthe ampelina]|uniref:Uncharacterized protein n=1 Tax=Diaporthe ampelina TaxID=1214573 RepID=A0A0G2H2C2_9PEZI|nr:hypothetical protein UCDDA912_g10624 [Diaporthe ampelina]